MQLYRPNTLLTTGSHNKPIILFLLGHLRILASQFFRDGLASSTRSTYNAGQQKFIKFCTSAKVHPVPTTEATSTLISTHLAAMNISYATIKVYLAAVRYLYVSVGLHNHFSLQLMPRLQQVLCGIKKRQAVSHPARICLPITLKIMGKIKEVLLREPQSFTNMMLWAPCCIAFFGFMGVGEFTIPGPRDYDASIHSTFSDITVNSCGNPRLLQVTIKQSKTDPFRRRVNIYLEAADSAICPISGILPYLTARGNKAGPLSSHRMAKG